MMPTMVIDIATVWRQEHQEEQRMIFAVMRKGEPMSEWIVSDKDLGCDGAYFSYEEVIRCENCKHWEGEKRGKCYYFEQCSLLDIPASSYDFCSHAERR